MPEQDVSLEEIKKQCVFCHIIAGRVESKKVYEDQKVSAVLDINPGNPGHVLLLIKEHYAIMPQISDDDIGYLGMTSKALSASLLRAIKCQGITVFIANGVAAGQRAQHFMVHLIPRIENDGLGMELPAHKIGVDKLVELKKQMLPSVKKLFGEVVEDLPVLENLKEYVKKEEKKSGVDLDDIARLFG